MCVHACVCLPVRLSTVFLGNSSGSERETWIVVSRSMIMEHDYGAEKAGEAGETDGCQGECALNEIEDDHCTYTPCV